jgi:predicted enzyme related to lactoylglutathione lyase
MVANHKIVHMEIPVNNIKKAKEFYEKMFNWQVTITGDNYAFFKDAEDGIGGGFEVSDKKMRGEFILYISTESIEDSLEKILEIGGKLVKEKTKISDEHGFYATFEDIFGNIMGLWSRK